MLDVLMVLGGGFERWALLGGVRFGVRRCRKALGDTGRRCVKLGGVKFVRKCCLTWDGFVRVRAVLEGVG